jgi:hypothetical protein
MRSKIERQFEAFGWTFDLKFSDEDGTEFIRIHRPDDRGTGEIFIEEGSPLEDETIRAVQSLKRFVNFEDDTYSDLKAAEEEYYEPDWDEGYDQGDDVADALSSRDDEMGQ